MSHPLDIRVSRDLASLAALSLAALVLAGCGKESTPAQYGPSMNETVRLAVDSTPTDAGPFGTIDLMRSGALPFSVSDSTVARAPLDGWPGDYLKDPQLYAVTAEFGSSVIDMKSLPSRVSRVDVAPKPWTSYWFPRFEKALFLGDDSPLRKYDRYRKDVLRENSTAQLQEARTYEGAPVPSVWEGLCDAWALASISSREPVRPVRYRNIDFKVSDLKGLLLKTYEGVDPSELKMYGQRFTGDYKGWIHPDTFPDQFHRFVEIMIFQRRQAFLMDHDAGPEVWNIPAFGANYMMEPVAGDPNAVSVRLWLYTLDSAQTTERELTGTGPNGSKELMREYNYILTGRTDGAGRMTVTGGYWTVSRTGTNSRADHPDFLWVPKNPSAVPRKVLDVNSEIKIDVVDQILRESY